MFVWLWLVVGAFVACAVGFSADRLIGVAAALGIWVGTVALSLGGIGRRLPGRACGKCGYSMQGVPGLTCPECGRQAASESKLRGPRRRRWGLVAAGVAAVILSGSLWVASTNRFDFWGRAPNWVVILGLRLQIPQAFRAVELNGWPYWSGPRFSRREWKTIAELYISRAARQDVRSDSRYLAVHLCFEHGNPFDPRLLGLYETMTSEAKTDQSSNGKSMSAVPQGLTIRPAHQKTECDAIAAICKDRKIHPSIRYEYIEWLMLSEDCLVSGVAEDVLAVCDADESELIQGASRVARERLLEFYQKRKRQ